MRKRLFILGLVTIVTAAMLAGCGSKNTNSATATDTTDTTEASMTITEKKMYADFAKGCPDSFEPSGDWSNGSMFNVRQHRTIAEASAVESPIRQETIGFPAHFFARAHNFKPPGRACQPEADSPMRT